MKKLICLLFGHKYEQLTAFVQGKAIRQCKRCGKMQKSFLFIWSDL